ncbi:MAG: DMT family transporter [Caldilineaceae bacterium]|nr:DMT family transporter [Caldilineaceae bacterium]
MTKRRAVLYLLIAVIGFSTSGVLVKLTTLDALALTAGRSIVAGAVFWAYLGRPHFARSIAQVGGGLAFVGAQVFFVAATQLTSAANAILLQYTAPIYVAVFGFWFLGERVRRLDWAAMLVIGAGMAFFFAGDLTQSGLLGNVYAILSGVSLAWLVLFMRKQKDGSPLETVLVGSIFAALLGAPSLLRSTPTMNDWLIILFLGVVQLGIPFILYSLAIRRLEAVEAILIQALEPILNPIWVFLAIDERPSRQALLGGALVLTAVTGRALLAARRR